MKSSHHYIPGPGSHWRAVFQSCQYLYIVSGFLNPWRANENRVEWSIAKSRYVEICLKAFYLPTERVAAHFNIHCPQRIAVKPYYVTGEKDHTGAGAQDRHAVGYHPLEAGGKLIFL